ncbi:hypothetical protein [Mycobacterium palustre]|uniref:Uncharacterized protein n=1 Tax=Mycobacterium palustre TaxID=153971 RepID=A0A1X1YY50_9MYCO|nr:hypothetical protein [Mycobacterium palustre]MCV7100494.1 hypothetical protein [Mycobacterium palustre]ORW16012.1 hypothetical protein AWC19_22945 [Mycobacterium palustre]
MGIGATASDSVPRDTVRLTVGTDASTFVRLGHASTSPTATTAAEPITTVPATGTREPAPGNLTRMAADDIPCVK